MALKVHDTVMIYQDPITQLKPEGKAVLLHKIQDFSDGLEYWKVRFVDDGQFCARTILASA